MILVGSQRGGGRDLAHHLMKPENDHVEIHELRGFAATTLHGVFVEAYAVSKGARCKQYLFSLSLNPPEDAAVLVTQFEAAIDRAEGALGLGGQPRAIVFHEKEGRRHAHVVWSRINAEEMKAVPLPFTKRTLFALSRELFLEHGWTLPRGYAAATERNPYNMTLAEWQEAKRKGEDPNYIKAALVDAWAISDDATAFAHALNDRGFKLARGDRRGHVVVDVMGNVYSLSRWLGVKAKELRHRLPAAEDCPSTDEASAALAAVEYDAVRRYRSELREAAVIVKAEYAEQRQEMVAHQRRVRANLLAEQRRRQEAAAAERANRFRRGLPGLWDRIRGEHARIAEQNAKEAAAAESADRAAREKLVKRQLAQRRELKRQAAARLAELKQSTRQLRTDEDFYDRMRRLADRSLPTENGNTEDRRRSRQPPDWGPER